MIKSLYGKLFFAFLFSIGLSFTIAGYTGLQRHQANLVESVIHQYDRVRDIVEEKIILHDEAGIANLIYSADMEMLVVEEEDMYLYGTDHTQAEFNSESAQTFYDLISDKIALKPVAELEGMYKLGYDYFIENQIGDSIAFFRVNIEEEQKTFEDAALTALLGIFVIGTIVFLVFADYLIKPIKRLTQATIEVTQGNYDVEVTHKGKDEIATLSDSFNLMTKRLAKSEENRQKFISDVSHEFQTPLTSISGFAKILTAEQLNDDQRRRYGNIILVQSIRLSNLAKSMMQLTLLEGDDLSLDKTKYSLSKQILRIIEMQQTSASEREIDIVAKIPKGDISIIADENRMEQVFINLINNAVKYTQDEGVVTVTIKKNIMDIEVIVEDTGIGISKDAVQHIFDRFFRVDKSRSVRGNGLGLSIVKRILDLHGYKIMVESQEEVGSVFRVIIPFEVGLRISKKD